MTLHPGDRFLFIGDSITDCGRRRPVGEAPPVDALGDGYVRQVDALLRAGSDPTIRILNMGVGGDTVRDLAARWQRDVIALRPDWLSIFIGINDAWRRIDHPADVDTHVSLGEFASTLDALIERVEARLRGLMLITPYFIEPDRADPLRAMMERYATTVRDAAAAHGALLVDTQAAFDDALHRLRPESLSQDRIHVNREGHAILAHAVLDALGNAEQAVL